MQDGSAKLYIYNNIDKTYLMTRPAPGPTEPRGGPGDTTDQPKGPTGPWGGSEGMNARHVHKFSPLLGVQRCLCWRRNRGTAVELNALF